MSDINDRYKKAAALRLQSAVAGVPAAQSAGAPNYSAIPLDPPQPARYPGFGTGIANALEVFGFGKPAAGAAQAPNARPPMPPGPMPYQITSFNGPHNLANTPWWTPEGEPLTNGDPSPLSTPHPPSLPPAINLGGMPAANPTAQDYEDAARRGPQMPVSAPPAMPAAPQGADAAFVPPPGWMPPADYMRTMGDADLGGYGGNPGMGRPVPAPPQYTNLNPTPSLEEIFRREYAANPGAFGKIG